MSLDLETEFESFADENTLRNGPICTVCGFPEEIQGLVAVASERRRPASVVSKFLERKGYIVSEGSVRRHVRLHVKR